VQRGQKPTSGGGANDRNDPLGEGDEERESIIKKKPLAKGESASKDSSGRDPPKGRGIARSLRVKQWCNIDTSEDAAGIQGETDHLNNMGDVQT